jgi:hypothetical protein
MKNIPILPTAEEILTLLIPQKENVSKEENKNSIEQNIDILKGWATLHVEAALKAAKKKTYKKVNMRHYEDELYKDEILTNTIIKSYPLNNIK